LCPNGSKVGERNISLKLEIQMRTTHAGGQRAPSVVAAGRQLRYR
ncbi:unnamed protein product, partial [Urochloa humidicola]